MCLSLANWPACRTPPATARTPVFLVQPFGSAPCSKSSSSRSVPFFPSAAPGPALSELPSSQLTASVTATNRGRFIALRSQHVRQKSQSETVLSRVLGLWPKLNRDPEGDIGCRSL